MKTHVLFSVTFVRISCRLWDCHHNHRHQSGTDRPVPTFYSSLFKGLPSRVRPFVLQFNITLVTLLLLFILVTCRHFSFSSTGYTSNSSKISSSPLWSRGFYAAVLLKKIRLQWCQSFLFFFLSVQISLPYTRMRTASFLLENFWTKVGKSDV